MKHSHDVESSNIQHLDHDGVATMHVTFKHGGKYSYSPVPFDAFTELLNAPSIGKHLNGMGIRGVKIPE